MTCLCIFINGIHLGRLLGSAEIINGPHLALSSALYMLGALAESQICCYLRINTSDKQ